MKQWLRITGMNLKNLPARIGISLVICVGTASVVAVLVTVLSMAGGLTDAFVSGADPTRIVVMRKGALAESLSSLSRDAVLAVETAPGIASQDGRLLVSPEIVLSVNLPRVGDGEPIPVFVRGLTEPGWMVRDDLIVAEGRLPAPGRFEVIVGRAIGRELAAAAVGDVLDFHSNRWTVVGVFDQEGGAAESQVFADAFTLMSAANRSVYSSVTAVMADMGRFGELKTALEDDPRLVVVAQSETDYLASQAESASGVLELIAYVVSGIMALGALFGAVNTMYTAVAARTSEIATLRAIGFGGSAVVVSVLAEAMLLSAIGAVFGAAVSWFLFNGTAFNAGGQLGAIGVQLDVGVPVILLGVVWACVLGFVAGLFPAVRAARMSVADGLRVDL